MSAKSQMSDDTVLTELGRALAERRLGMGLTQFELAKQAGIGKRTVERLEAGNSCQTSALIRVLRVLELLDSLRQLVPLTGSRPMDLLKLKGKERKRASSKGRRTTKSTGDWAWGDEA